MQSNALIFARGVIILAVAMLAVMLIGLGLEALAGYPFEGPFTFGPNAARHLNNLLNRNLNQLVGVVFTAVAIAVPLTANLYSLKFLEFFIKDPVNAAVLIFVVFTDLNNSWVGYWLKETTVAPVQLNISFILTFVCFALQFPYLYYIFRFLHPQTLLQRLENATVTALHTAQRRQNSHADLRREVAEGIEHIANIAVRSIERSDRNTAIESIAALERILKTYWSIKANLPASWFQPEAHFFVGFSDAALEEMRTNRSWVAMKTFGQMREILNVAIGRMPDAVSNIARSLQALGLEPAVRQDAVLRDLIVVYFNTFLRLALNRRDTRTVFVMLDAYRALAEAWNAEYPDLVAEIAYYFEYYGQIARDLNITFLVEFSAHNLADLVRYAWQQQAPNRPKLLERFLLFDTRARTPLPGVKKAQAILASFFLMRGDTAPVDLIQESFRDLDPAFVNMIRADLFNVRHEKFWEVSEGRHTNIDYVPEPQREYLQRFFERVQALTPVE